jgi:hypothetical protein
MASPPRQMRALAYVTFVGPSKSQEACSPCQRSELHEILGRPSRPGRKQALDRAERLRPIMVELADLSARAAAATLNARGIETPARGRWHTVTINRVRARLHSRATPRSINLPVIDCPAQAGRPREWRPPPGEGSCVAEYRR